MKPRNSFALAAALMRASKVESKKNKNKSKAKRKVWRKEIRENQE